MRIIKFKKFLLEGGNVRLKSGESAQKIPLENVDRKEVQTLVKSALVAFNNQYEKQMGKPLWKNVEDLIKRELIFSGSTRSFFANYISDKDFMASKKFVGDIDLMFPEEYVADVKKFLDANIGKMFGQLRYVDEGGNSITQWNTLFEMPKEYWDRIRFVQIDFEPVPFKKEKEEPTEPTEFSIFAHYSSWKDITEGIKGVFIKFLYRSLFSNLQKLSNYVVVTNKGKVSTSKEFAKDVGLYKFSVDKGVRIGYEPIYEDGVQKQIDGKLAFRQIDPKDSTYEQSLKTIYTMAFKKEPTDEDIKDMHSFVGSLKMLKDVDLNMDVIYMDFINLLWGSGAQGLERDNPKIDFENKKAARDRFVAEFPELKKHDNDIQNMIETFYQNYK